MLLKWDLIDADQNMNKKYIKMLFQTYMIKDLWQQKCDESQPCR